MMWRILLCMAVLLISDRCLAASEISSDNVGRLILHLALPMDQQGGYAGAPLVADGRLFLITPFPHRVLALDLAHPDAPMIWQYSHQADERAAGLASGDLTTGGLAVGAGHVFLNTFDGHTVALDAASGSVAWDVAMADVGRGETLLAAPVVAKDRVIVGNNGSDFGVRGWIAALDASSGRVRWKRYNTGPDDEVGITKADIGVTSWPPDAWQQGGGDLAGTPLYDAALNELIYATGHPAPWNGEQRPGANYFTSSLIARDVASGAVRWFMPVNPHDRYALGAAGSLLAADIRWQGSDRAVLLHPDASGTVYVLDRASGEILSANRFIAVSAKDTHVNSTTRDICPASPGATGGTAQAAFSPQTGLLYIPASRLCMDMESRQVSFMSGLPYVGANIRVKAPRDAKGRGALIAWDVAAGKPAWQVEESLPVESGVLATTSGVVFYGTLDGWLKAVDAKSGQPLWQFHAASGIIGQPTSFQGADGRDYVAVLAGTGGAAGAVAQDEIDVRDATAANGYANALRDLKPSRPGGMLYLFGLP